MERINFTLSKVHEKKLRKMSKKMGVSISEFLRRGIDEAWKKFERRVSIV